MTAPLTDTALPCPHAQPEFYDGVVFKRGMAWIIDVAIIAALTVCASLLTIGIGFFFFPLLFLVIGGVYRISTLAARSATLGMRMMGIELRDFHGQRFDGSQAALHVLGYYASVMFAILPALASVVAMLVTERKQGLTDLVLGTAAINRPG